jgi:hypothetical protein
MGKNEKQVSLWGSRPLSHLVLHKKSDDNIKTKEQGKKERRGWRGRRGGGDGNEARPRSEEIE